MEITAQCVFLSAILLVLATYRVTALAAPGQPVITNFPTTAIVGELLTVTCTSVGGDPNPSLWWNEDTAQKDNSFSLEGSTSTTVNQYTFIVVRSHESVEFRCIAWNSQASLTEARTFVAVYAAPGQPVITNFPTTAIVGELHTVTCTSVGGNPNPSLWWNEDTAQKDNSFSLEGSTSTTVNQYTFIVVRSHESVEFRCIAWNSQASLTEARTFVAVYATPGNPVMTGPITFNAGSTNTWYCQTVGGYPTPSIAWYLGGDLLTGDGTNVTTNNNTYTLDSSLTRTALAADNGKQLQCRVSHAQTLTTPKTASKTFTVYAPPTVSVTPDLTNVLAGNDLTLTCSVTSSVVSYSVTWYKLGSGTALTAGTDYTISGNALTILNAAAGDAGNYYCTATNSAGTSSNSNNVEVVFYTIPTSAAISPTSVTVQVGQSFTVNCSANASPSGSLSYSWTFGASVLSSISSLVVSNVQKDDSGTYTCEAINSYGTTEATVVVDIQYAPESTVTQPSIEAAVGTSVSLSCDTDANPAATGFVWFKGSAQLGITDQVNSVQAESATATYTCRATNSIGQSGDIVFTVTGTSTGGGATPDAGASTGDTATGLSTGVIVAIVLGILFILLVLIIIIVCCICAGSCKKKEKKKKSQITPKPEPTEYRVEQPAADVDTYSTPRNKPRPYRYYSDGNKGGFDASIISRKHVDVDLESSDGYGYGYVYGNDYRADTHRSTTSRFLVRAPPTAVESENGTIISVYDDSRQLTSKPKRPVHKKKEHTYEDLDDVRRQRRSHHKKRRRHHKREAGEGEESPPRKERRSREESEHQDGSLRRKEKRDKSRHKRSSRERREESEDLGEHGYISDGSPVYSQDNLVHNN